MPRGLDASLFSRMTIKDVKDKPNRSKEPSYLDIPVKSSCYKMDHKHRGKAIIFNQYSFANKKIETRKGSREDVKNLKVVLKNLKFQVANYEDLKYEEIKQVLKTLSKEDHRKNDCLVIVAMSHGNGNEIEARDFSYKVENIWCYFTGDKCPSLAGKPKLFFIQACRGDERKLRDRGVKVRASSSTDACSIENNEFEEFVIPVVADILVMYSTSKDYPAYRSHEKGSWFIQCLCSRLEKYARRYDLLKILTRVNQKMAIDFGNIDPRKEKRNEVSQKQMPSIVSGLTREVYFFPEEEDEDEEEYDDEYEEEDDDDEEEDYYYYN